jgi:hypothetical protein
VWVTFRITLDFGVWKESEGIEKSPWGSPCRRRRGLGVVGEDDVIRALEAATIVGLLVSVGPHVFHDPDPVPRQYSRGAQALEPRGELLEPSSGLTPEVSRCRPS